MPGATIMTRLAALSASLAMLLTTASVATAAGGAHVVDDAGVETPGACHLETWVAQHGGGGTDLHLAPACTSKTLPRVELGAAIQRSWGGGVDTDTLAGPTLKINISPLETGVGLGIIANAVWSTQTARLDTASLVVPVSLRISPHLRTNLNVGWLHTPYSEKSDHVFLGAQIEADVLENLMVMAETFTHGEGRIGGQLGLRWSPVPGAVEVDLLSGWRAEEGSPWTVTIGLTVRR